ncbi:hypothetical protein EEB14_51185 [Rhodococcus sp. WS4]|nr:hypothetical protein EEB14_51185 [Rhodococcus sp. WS4]
MNSAEYAFIAISDISSSGSSRPSVHDVLTQGGSPTFFTAVPCCWCVLADARCLPHGRHRARDRHLNFYDVRDNLFVDEAKGRLGTRDSLGPDSDRAQDCHVSVRCE